LILDKTFNAMYEGSSWRPVVAAWIIGGSRDDFRLPPFCLFGRTARIHARLPAPRVDGCTGRVRVPEAPRVRWTGKK
nr:hypothetical protein [Candidatus Sigynarchaeum springense]